MKNLYSRRSLIGAFTAAVCYQDYCLGSVTRQGELRCSSTRRTPAYRTQVAFCNFVDAPPKLATLGEMLEEINEKGKVSLLAAERWSETFLALRLGRVVVAVVMDALSETYAGSWHQFERQWVLASQEREALNLVSRQQQSEDRKDPKRRLTRAYGQKFKAFASSISPQQWRALESGEKLSARDLSPVQWQVLRGSLADIAQVWAGTPLALDPSALQGNVVISMEKRAPGWTTLNVKMPQLDGVQDGAPEGVLNLESGGHGGWSPIPPERLFDLLEAAKAEKGDPEALTEDRITELQKSPFGADYHLDERYQHKVTVSGRDDGEAILRAICKHPAASLIMRGEWLRKPQGIVHRDDPAWRVMDSLVTMVQGEWKAIGPIWVLGPEKKKPAVLVRPKQTKSS